MIGRMPFRRGEEVVCRRNDEQLNLLNGTTGTVQEIDESAGLLIRTDNGSR